MSTTTNDLAGYPMVLAMSQDMINARLKDVSQKTHDLPSGWDLKGSNHQWSLKVTFENPQIDFNTNLKNGCRLILKIKSGGVITHTVDFDHPDKDGHYSAKKVLTDLTGNYFYVTTPMSHIHHDKFDDADFLVQSIFADLTNTHSVEFKIAHNTKINLAGVPPASLETLISDQIKAYGKEHPDALIFGKVTIPKVAADQQTTGKLKPQKSSYSTTHVGEIGDNYLTGALNFLLWIDASDAPTGGAIGEFNDLLLTKDSHGNYSPATLVISDTVILERYITPKMVDTYKNKDGSKPTFNTVARTGGANAKVSLASTFTKSTDKGHFQYNSIDLEYNAAKHSYRISYQGQAKAEHWSGDIKADVNGTIDIVFVMDVEGKISTTTSHNMNKKWADKSFGNIMGDIITFSLDEIGIANRTQDIQDMCSNINANLGTNIKGSLDAIELPGQKAVFTYSSIVNSGPLNLTCAYKPDPS